jgi:TRAP-type C4-dicarboxylate transport system permease small subunit
MSAPPPTRRWFQFGIGTMFLAVTILALWLGWELRIVHQRKRRCGG